VVGLLVALGAGMFAGGVAIEARNPIKPAPAEVTVEQQQAHLDRCMAEMGGTPSTDAEQIERLQRLAQRLEPFQTEPYSWTLVHNDRVNAASCGLGKILVEEKLAKLLTDDELLYVMAHEQGHNELQHSQQNISYLEQGKWRLNIPIFNIDPRAGFYAFARGQELSADCYAQRVARALGIPDAAWASAMHKTNPSGAGGQTHPGTAGREQNLKSCSA
jgi:Zn-dependent protease with chaperone function